MWVWKIRGSGNETQANIHIRAEPSCRREAKVIRKQAFGMTQGKLGGAAERITWQRGAEATLDAMVGLPSEVLYAPAF